LDNKGNQWAAQDLVTAVWNVVTPSAFAGLNRALKPDTVKVPIANHRRLCVLLRGFASPDLVEEFLEEFDEKFVRGPHRNVRPLICSHIIRPTVENR